MRSFLFSLSFLVLSVRVFAQVDTTLQVVREQMAIKTESLAPNQDSSTVEVNQKRSRIGHFLKSDYPNPRKAMFLSLALPGAGQLYNRKYWKLPIVYGVFAGGIYLYNDNYTLYRDLRNEYKARVDGDDQTMGSPRFSGLNTTSVLSNRNKYRNQSDRIGLGLVLIYVLTAADAFVDAHLKSFDVSDDLSLRIGPAQQQIGIGLALNW